jgi:4-amino-4-deoxy-L-arabinose transferase-like glycosyltransferase
VIDAPAVGPAVSGASITTTRVAVATTSPPWRPVDAFWLAVLAVVAAIPRMVNLLGLDPFVDEAAWVDWALRQFEWSSPSTWLVSVLKDGRPPLFVWLIAPVGLVVDNGMLAGRLASALAGVTSTLALYALGRELASRTVGLAAGVLWAVCPFSVFFARVAADDAVLALTAILATWASVRLARQPSLLVGALCGLTLALAVLAKTSGLLMAVAPPLALLFLGRPRAWRSYIMPLLAAGVVGLVTVAPLLLGLAQLLDQVALHTPSATTQKAGSLLANLQLVGFWADVYAGRSLQMVALVGTLLALVFRQRGLLFVAALGVVMLLVMLKISTSLFPRYVLFAVFPAFLLASYAVERAACVAGLALARLAVGDGRLPLVARSLVVAVLLTTVVAERAPLAFAIVQDPARAAIPDTEHFRYVEQWFAVYGLGQVMDELHARASSGPVTVLVPPPSRESRVLVPYAALGFYARRDPSVRIVEAPSLWRAQDLRELRQLARGGPTYLVVNGSHTDAPGMPNDIPAYTQRLERRLAQDVPAAREVLRIPRPSAPNWLSLYRLDGGP